MIHVGVIGAFLGGLLALLSPCSALLLPSFFAYAFTDGRTILARTAIFLAGLATVLIPLGAGVGAVGAAITAYRTQTTLAAAVVIIALGVAMILGKGFTVGRAQRTAGSLRVQGPLSVFALGTVYGLAGFCSGPLLGAILTVAVVGSDPLYGALLMAVYAVGMTVPLALLALTWDRLRMGEKSWLRGRPLRIGPLHAHTNSVISGVLFVGIGVFFLTTAGTANLGGILSAETEVAVQGWLRRAVADPDLVLGVGLVASLVAVAVLAVRVRAAKRDNAIEPRPSQDRVEDSRF
ncbi:cytochrome c biogenesis CcdA family protein [Mycolicibacterium pallens]|uniref:Cytochrome c biogenesis CcdA family protein n=1 Tax=Mycolicibacterium pallens TaxID=370524 RepID=A0ABX8VRP7_9MYCO|nr:cytochrome c biogenesis CcdA family protein [Mycolicibacterium pallens]QYL18818.1 cytochrome c biogenesis CcdA family protein [Mycolicibacterium pallens]